MMRKLFFVLIMAALVSAITVSNYTTDKATYSPGDKGTVTLNINFDYPVSSSEELVGFTGVAVELSSPIVSKTVSLGKISPGTLSLTFPVEVDKDAKEGVYAVVVQVYASATVKSGSNTNDKVANTRSIVPIKVVREPKLSVDLFPTQISKQGTATLTLCSKNGIAREVTLSSEDIYLDGGKVFFEEVLGCEQANISYDASSLESGTNNVLIELTYKDILGDEHSDEVTIPLTLSKEETRFLIAQRGELPHKRTSKLSLVLENRGRMATDIRITPKEGLSFPGISEVFVGALDAGASKEITVPAYTEMDPGTKTAKLTVSWKEEGKEKTEELSLPLSIVDDNPIEVFVEATPAPLRQGQEHTLSVVVANRASYPLSAVSAKLESDVLQLLEIQEERFVGSLEGDDFSSQQFKVKAQSSGEGVLNITISYRDPSGSDRQVSKTIHIKVLDQDKEETPLIVVVATLVAIAGLGKLYIDKRKRSKK